MPFCSHKYLHDKGINYERQNTFSFNDDVNLSILTYSYLIVQNNFDYSSSMPEIFDSLLTMKFS